MGKSAIRSIIIPHRKLGLPIIEFVFILLACLFYSNFEVQASYSFPMVFVFTGYVLYCYFKEPVFRKLIVRFLVMLVLFSLLYLFLTDTLSIGENVSNRNLKRFYSKYGQFLFMFVPLFMFYRTATIATRKQIYVFFGIILFNLFILARTAISATIINQEVLHSFNQDAVEESGLSMAAFYFVYAYTFLVLIGWECFKYVKNNAIRYSSLVIALFSLYFLVRAQFALSIVTTFLSMLYLYIITTQNKGRRFKAVVVVLLILILSPLLIRLIISISSSRILNDRLSEIYDMITGENTSSGTDGQGRLDLYWMCIKAFFSSPIIGNRSLPLDGHATFLTIPADIGIYGIVFLYTFFKNSYKIIGKVLGSRIIYFKPLMFQIVLMGFTNPIHSSPTIYIILFFFGPLVIMRFIEAKNTKVIKFGSK